MKKRLGILLGRASADAAFVERPGRRRQKFIARVRADAETALWQDGYVGLVPLFRALARSLPSEARRADVEHRIALPDPLVTEDRLTFNDLPATPEECLDLIHWRIAREHRRTPESIACAWQVDKVRGSETDVLVRIIEKNLLDAVTEAAGAAGFFPTRLDGWSSYVLSQPLVTKATSGARLWANDDWWSLMCWAHLDPAEAAAGGETLVHSEWLDADAPPDAIAGKVARLAKSFAFSSGAEQLPLDFDLPDLVAERVRKSLALHTALLPPADNAPILSGGADCVALDAT